MKISRITIENVRGIKSAALQLTTPVTLITAPNGNGKTSIVEAVHMALTSSLARIDKQKDAGRLVHDGARSGFVEVVADEYDKPFTVQIGSAKVAWKNPCGEQGPEFIDYILKPHLFAAQDDKGRRAALYRLLQIDEGPGGILPRLQERKCNQAKIDKVASMLRTGLDDAHKFAAGQATEAKGAWRGVTQQTWGSKVGETWRAPEPRFTGDDAAELGTIDKAIAAYETELGDAQKRLGEAAYALQQLRDHTQKVENLTTIAAKLDEHTKLTEKASGELKELEDELQQAREKAGIAPKTKPRLLPCPDCGAALCLQDDGTLAGYPTLPADPPHDPDAAASIPGIEKAIGTMRAVVARHTKNRDDAATAAANLKAMPAAPEKIDPAPIRQTVETLKTQIEAKRARQRELQEAQKAIDEADRRTKDARGHHADVLEWDEIAKALSPNGIPAELLSEALGPFNERLAQAQEDTRLKPDHPQAVLDGNDNDIGWMLVQIDKDMSIRAGGRLYDDLCESEQWRVDAHIAEAFSFLSGLRLLVLDRFDRNVGVERLRAVRWIDTLAYGGDIDRAIVLMAHGDEPMPELTEDWTHLQLHLGEIVRSEELEAA